MFKESVKCVARKFPKKVSRVFQECFKEVLFCNFVLSWISLQLPEQKEGLFLGFANVLSPQIFSHKDLRYSIFGNHA